MEPTKIPNLKQVIKEAMFAYINKHPEHPFLNNLSKIDHNKIDKFIHWLIYENNQSALIRDFVEIEGFSYLNFNEENEVTEFIFKGVESEYKVSLWISSSSFLNQYCRESQKSKYIFDANYLFNLMDKYIPKGLYKASPLFKNAKPVRIQTKDIEVWRDTKASEDPRDKIASIYGDLSIYFFNNQLEEIFKTHVVDFINDPQQLILEATDIYAGKIKYPKDILFYGIRLYKLPDVDYSQEYQILEKVMAKWGKIPYVDYQGYMTSCVSFELSPDNYLELYATSAGFNLLFPRGLLQGTQVADPIFIAQVDYVEEQFLILYKKFGSPQNQLFDQARIALVSEGRDNYE